MLFRSKVETKTIKEDSSNSSKKSQTKVIKQDDSKPNASSDTNQNKEINQLKDKPKRKTPHAYTKYTFEESIQIYVEVKEKIITREEAFKKYNISRYQYDRARKHQEELSKKSD